MNKTHEFIIRITQRYIIKRNVICITTYIYTEVDRKKSKFESEK